MTMTTDVVKPKTTKDVIAYLAKKFPQCFTEKGEASPLKIGIFEDLTKRLEGDDNVSKTRLRAALRNYTSSWRYLRNVKVGTHRIDLDGNPCEKVDEGQQQHAVQLLAQSKAAVAAARVAGLRNNSAQADQPVPRKRRPSPRAGNLPQKRAAKARVSNPNKVKRPQSARADMQVVPAQQLKIGQQVRVNAGKTPVTGVVTEIDRGDIYVQLQNGLTVKVGSATVFVTTQE